MDFLVANDYEWLKTIIGFGKLKVEPSAFIGEKRNVDLLVKILDYHDNKTQKVGVEIENDREFDADAVLRKIKKDQPCPTIAIIPQEHENDAWRFQESLIKVWFWKVRCKWKCRSCNSIFTTSSSITPNKCGSEDCGRGSNFLVFDGVEHNGKPFIEAENNPSMTFEEIQRSIKVPSKLPIESIFESRCARLKRIREVPPKPIIELFIGSTSETKEWLPTTRENLDLMRCIPDVFKEKDVIRRREHFDFQSRSPEIFARMFSDGFFHCILPWCEINPEDEEAKYYHAYWLMCDVGEPLFFLVRVMKLKEVEIEHTFKLDLHGISGLQVFPFSRERAFLPSRRTWSFSEDADFLSYQKTFNPKEKWISLFNLLCEIYKEICNDLGIFDMKDETVSQNVKKIVSSMRSLRTTYSGRGLERLSLEEIFGESSN